MGNSNNPTNDFEFGFVESESEGIGKFAEDASAFDESASEFADKSEVIIFTDNFRIQGKVALVPGARLTDFIVDTKLFIAVADVEVRDKAGDLVFKTPFLDVHRDHIEIILPAELATMA